MGKKTDGWVRFHRKSIESSVFQNPNIWFVWCWCLLKATHKEFKFPFNGKDITLYPGEFITGRNKALLELRGLSERQWRNAMGYLKTTSRVSIKTTNKFSLVKVNKWHEYQVDDRQNVQQTSSQRPTNVQQTSTYKNIKNVKNVEEDALLSAEADVHTLSGFDLFWEAYPNKGQKRRAKEVWERKKLDGLTEVIVDFVKQAEETDRWVKGFVKLPSAFLIGECWNDDLGSYNDKAVRDGGSKMLTIEDD